MGYGGGSIQDIQEHTEVVSVKLHHDRHTPRQHRSSSSGSSRPARQDKSPGHLRIRQPPPQPPLPPETTIIESPPPPNTISTRTYLPKARNRLCTEHPAPLLTFLPDGVNAGDSCSSPAAASTCWPVELVGGCGAGQGSVCMRNKEQMCRFRGC